MDPSPPTVEEIVARVRAGGASRYHDQAKQRAKLFVRDRLRLLLDEEPRSEDGLFANVLDDELPADGVVTGLGRVNGRRVCFMANDSTVKAGSWGWRTVEKIIRILETSQRLQLPMVYLVDSAGARITDQLEMFPGRRGAGRIFHMQTKLSGLVPQVCLLLGPSAAGGAYIPAFCDVVIMVDGNASMFLGSPRMAQMVIGENVTLEEMGGAKMHCSVSGCGDVLVADEAEGIESVKRYLSYFPPNYREAPPPATAIASASGPSLVETIPHDQNRAFDMRKLIGAIVDAESLFEIKQLWAGEIITALARIDGSVVGVLANQPMVKGGVLFVDSADKAARFVWLCDAFNIPLLFLADVPGFMIGTVVERQGIIRAGAKMISAVSDATVPKISVVVRKCYGAGLYAMCGPAFEPDVSLALPTAKIAVMGPEAAINAVHYNRIEAMEEPERSAWIEDQRRQYEAEIDLYRLAGELIVDDVVAPDALREVLIERFAGLTSKVVHPIAKRRSVLPV
jgi:acetyl-CoA carboxylase carboxyltransferase component